MKKLRHHMPREDFEATANENLQVVVAKSKKIRNKYRKLEEEVAKKEEKIRNYQTRFEEIQTQLVKIQSEVYAKGTA